MASVEETPDETADVSAASVAADASTSAASANPEPASGPVTVPPEVRKNRGTPGLSCALN